MMCLSISSICGSGGDDYFKTHAKQNRKKKVTKLQICILVCRSINSSLHDVLFICMRIWFLKYFCVKLLVSSDALLVNIIFCCFENEMLYIYIHIQTSY